MKSSMLQKRFFIGAVVTAWTALAMMSVQAQAPAVPHALVASPDIYKVIAENDKYRVIEVTWKPGQRDKLHSHPDSAIYYPMDCMLRAFGGNGELIGQSLRLAGTAVVQIAIPAHSVENAGTAPCKLVMFEPK
jgi:hypothetical protein